MMIYLLYAGVAMVYLLGFAATYALIHDGTSNDDGSAASWSLFWPMLLVVLMVACVIGGPPYLFYKAFRDYKGVK